MIAGITGTFTGEMTPPDGTVIPSAGKAFDLSLATTSQWGGDLLIEEFASLNSALQAQQIRLA